MCRRSGWLGSLGGSFFDWGLCWLSLVVGYGGLVDDLSEQCFAGAGWLLAAW